MLNTELYAVLAMIRRPQDSTSFMFPQEYGFDIKWWTMDPSIYISPFLDVIQSDNIPAMATNVALSTISKIFEITSCRLERTDTVTEDAIMMRILQALTSIIKHKASILLTNHSICTIVNICFQVVQQSMNRAYLLQRGTRYAMRDIIDVIFMRLQDVELKLGEESESDIEDADIDSNMDSGYGVSRVVDIFYFLCSLLNVVEVVEVERVSSHENIQIFGLVLINSAIELSRDAIGKHPKLLRIIQDDLFHHLIHYGMSSSPLMLSMICSTVLNIYHFLRRFIRVQLEAFFEFVLLKAATVGSSSQLQEVAEIGKLLCKLSFLGSSLLSFVQIQAFEGLQIIIHNIADNTILGREVLQRIRYWVDYLRFRKEQKKKILIAGDHFNRDEKKGLDYLKLCQLVSDPADPQAFAIFFRFTPGLDKSMIGDYLGDPDEFNMQVLKEFTETFQFSSTILDTALRTYLATFRLHGESQKIQFHDQQSSDTFASKDAVFILCYSLIMLNADQHNPQVKKKMTVDEFIRNNRAINGGQDLPREYLSELLQSIATNVITLFGQSGLVEMNPGTWIELMNRSKLIHPLILCDFEHRLGRDMFACIAGPSVAALSSFFEHADEDEMLHECIGCLISVARITQYDLEDILDELVASFSKFTTLLNPYASAEETLFAFSNDLKPRMATLAIVDCLLKLKRPKLLPQAVIEFDDTSASSSDGLRHKRNESGISHSYDPKFGTRRSAGMISRFSHFLTLDSMEDSISLGMRKFEQNLKIIKQCRIGSIFSNSCNLPDDALVNIGRSLIFAAGGKGQKFTTTIEEEETVGFCWDLIVAIALVYINRFHNFWPSFHENVAQFPLFSSIPFVEAFSRDERFPEEFIFKSINLMWKLDKEILDTCCRFITESVSKILTECPANLQTSLGWKSSLHLLSITGRHPETYEQGVDTLITLMSDAKYNSPLEKNLKILDLLSDSVNLLTQWCKDYTDSGSNFSVASSTNNSSMDDSSKVLHLEKLAWHHEKRSETIQSSLSKKSFSLAQELDFSPLNCINCFNLVIFAMVDDLHENMVEYSRRDNAEEEMRSMEGTLKLAMEPLANVYLQFLKPITLSPGFRTFCLGIITKMKEEEILVQKEEDDLWDVTYIQIQWIAPSLKEELFPDL
ncbi:hypothetical protein P3X46_019385 [Hevea brasiliensis]|uniref:SEC7 domain-containing protein n=1 Tax=Hevea brasiliensis TaxID=3981 RepID=A0ABQ9LIJ1_HEVBR|nr:hypothetical protein P3X46_019385 [Hevea brasiliensis]